MLENRERFAVNESSLGRRDRGKKRLLFLAQMLPYPPDIGVSIRSYNVLRILAREFAVTALCFYRRAHQSSPRDVSESLEALRAFADVRAFPIPQEHHRLRLVVDHASSLMTRQPYTVFAYRSSSFRWALRHLLATTTFHAAHIDSLDLAEYVPSLQGLPSVCVHHNVESDLLERRARTARLMERAYLHFQSRLTRAQERAYCPMFDLNVAVSQEDAARLMAIAPGSRFAVVPNGVDTVKFRPAETGDGAGGLVFVGGHSWPPNREAMAYFCADILPLLRARGFSPRITWVGSATSAAKKEFAARYDVHLTGYVDDIRAWVHGAQCYIVPLRAGGGTRLKILDAWAMGKAVVSTSVGCEGLLARHGENILVADTPADFASAVIAVLTDVSLRQQLAAAARRTAMEHYDWEVIARGMIPIYGSLLRASDGA
jgi:glycosyltransferase involved in cell wall biosynthesis